MKLSKLEQLFQTHHVDLYRCGRKSYRTCPLGTLATKIDPELKKTPAKFTDFVMLGHGKERMRVLENHGVPINVQAAFFSIWDSRPRTESRESCFDRALQAAR